MECVDCEIGLPGAGNTRGTGPRRAGTDSIMERAFKPLLLFLLLWLTAACSMNQTLPDTGPAPEVPAEFAGGEGARGHAPLEWWRAFEDPALNRIMDGVLESNFELAEAVARVEQARARARIAVAARFPTVQASSGVDEFDAPANAGLGAQLDELGLGSQVTETFGVVLPDRLDLTTYTLGAEFAYELDFWGRNRNAARAAGAERLAQEADFQAARIGILAETVSTYLEIVDLRRQRQLAGEIVRIFEEQETLAATRYEKGVADIRELYVARRSLRDGQAELPLIEGRLADAEARLWVLLGGYREDLENMIPDALSPATVTAPVPAGIPADLLAQRPDVGAALQRAEAARYTVGARRAELLPSLSLSGSIGLQSTGSGDWFDTDQWFRNLSANLLAPVFQGGRLRSQVALAEARLEEAAAALGRSVVSAVNEVEAALTVLEANRKRVSLLTGYVQETRAEAALQRERYVAGVGNYAIYLAASQSLVTARSALAGAERDLGYARLALHRALGGAWTTEGAAAVGQGNAGLPTSMEQILYRAASSHTALPFRRSSHVILPYERRWNEL